MIECRIERKDGHWSLFYLHLDDNSKFLLAGRKRKKSRTSNYLVSLDKEDLARGSGQYVGKVRANFVGTEYIFYDKVPFKNLSKADISLLGECSRYSRCYRRWT